jgi:inner membrane protein involved in colicin E2 resistance
VSFLIASAVSVVLIVTYLVKVAGMTFAVQRAAVAQVVFLVLFSYAFFFEGYSGLTVTIGSILTLFVLMQATAKVNWNEVFAGPAPVRRPSGSEAS